MNDTIQQSTATVTEKHAFVAETSPAIADVMLDTTPGDRIGVQYVRNGGVTTAVGTVESADADFGEIRFTTSNGTCYLHINVATGDYYFDDAFPASPEDGYRLTNISVTHRSN